VPEPETRGSHADLYKALSAEIIRYGQGQKDGVCRVRRWRCNCLPAREPVVFISLAQHHAPLRRLGRLIARDLIGMGDSDKLENSGPNRYTYAEHHDYLFALWDQLSLGDKIIMVLHDWGSALGFDWACSKGNRLHGIDCDTAYLGRLAGDCAARVLGFPIGKRRGDGSAEERVRRTRAAELDHPQTKRRENRYCFQVFITSAHRHSQLNYLLRPSSKSTPYPSNLAR
jgi:pimeloyl-ACP methyl ester carboxylesterase